MIIVPLFVLHQSLISCFLLICTALRMIPEHATSLCKSYSDAFHKLQAEFQRQSLRGIMTYAHLCLMLMTHFGVFWFSLYVFFSVPQLEV